MINVQLVNLPEFRAAMAEYSRMVPRELGHALNWKGLVIAKEAQKGTPIAQRAVIEYQMGVGGYVTKTLKAGKNKGKIRRTNMPIWFPHPRALQIILGREKRKGKIGIVFTDAMEKARRMVMAKVRAIGSAKAGWNRPLRMLAAAVKRESFQEGAKRRVKLEGYSKPAAPSQWKKSTEVSYEVLDKSRSHHSTIGGQGSAGAAYPKVVAALNAALSKEARRTLEYIRQRIEKSSKLIRSYR